MVAKAMELGQTYLAREGACVVRACAGDVYGRAMCRTHYERCRHGSSPAPNEVIVQCWCQAKLIIATPDEVWNGVTQSCGRKGCEFVEARSRTVIPN